MANRSYLYSFNQDKKEKITKIFDISEQNYEIPIIYKILVSENTEVVPSKIFDDHLALRGDAKAGRKKLNTFFKKLHKEQIYDDTELSDLEKMFQNHLDKYTLDYFLFEPIEVISMNDVDTNAAVKLIYSEIGKYNKMISNFILEAKSALEEWSALGIDFSNYLYFSMGNEKEVKKIEKQFSNKKLAEIKALIAKKPTIKRYFTLLKELDFKKDKEEVNETIDKIIALNPNFEELWDCAYYYQDLDKKIALFKQLIIEYPNEDKTKAINYWISNAYEDKKEYDLALKHNIQYILDKNDPNDDPYLDSIIEGGGFDALSIYQNLSKQVNNKYIERKLLKLAVKNKEYNKALQTFNNWDKKLKEENKYTVAWGFLNANQLEIAFKLIEDFKMYTVAKNYYRSIKEHKKAAYYFMKDYNYASQLIYDYSEGEFIEEKINFLDLFELVFEKIAEFKSKKLIKFSKDLIEAREISKATNENLLQVAEKVLLAVLSRKNRKTKHKAKAQLLLSILYKKQGETALAKSFKEQGLNTDETVKYKHLYTEFYRKKEYQKATENFAKYMQLSNKSYMSFAHSVEDFFDKGLYQETTILVPILLKKIDDDYDKMRFNNLLGLSYMHIDNYEQAYNNFVLAYKLDNSQTSIQTNIVLCAKRQYDKKNFDKALAYFTFCLQFKKDVETYSYLGTIYNLQNKDEQALDFFKKALELAPESKQSINNVKYMENKKKGKGFLGGLFKQKK